MKEHIFNIHDVVLLMTTAECILLAIFQAVLPAKNKVMRSAMGLEGNLPKLAKGERIV